jgi:hypothetical protein
MILCKSLLFDGRNILNGPALEKSVCVSKYRFLGSSPNPSRGEGSAKGIFCLYQKITDYITINGIQ